jgi:hypothetical protein
VRRTPLVLGALAIVFGALTAGLMLFALFAAAPSPEISAEQRFYQVASTATFSAMAIALVVIGVGLARRRRWSRVAGIAWAIVALAVVEFEFYVFGRLGGSTRTAGMYVTLFAEAIFPLTMLVLLARPSAKDDFV